MNKLSVKALLFGSAAYSLAVALYSVVYAIAYGERAGLSPVILLSLLPMCYALAIAFLLLKTEKSYRWIAHCCLTLGGIACPVIAVSSSGRQALIMMVCFAFAYAVAVGIYIAVRRHIDRTHAPEKAYRRQFK